MVALYRTYGPVFRLPQPGQEPRRILAGPEINVFLARHEDEFFTTGEQWEQFDAMISQQPKSGMTEARDGEANRKRRAQSSRQWSRARILDQIPQMVEITIESTQDWQPGSHIAVHASMRRLVAEQLGRLLLGVSPGAARRTAQDREHLDRELRRRAADQRPHEIQLSRGHA